MTATFFQSVTYQVLNYLFQLCLRLVNLLGRAFNHDVILTISKLNVNLENHTAILESHNIANSFTFK